MKKRGALAIAVVLVLAVAVFGCGKKKDVTQEPMTMEALNTINAPAPVVPEAKAPAAPGAEQQAMPAAPQAQPSVAPVAQPIEQAATTSIPSKPSAMDIQTALKNAGYYTGKIDGKIGPMTKKAIESFQKANNLTADGKVGPKTWAELGKYLIQQAAPALKQ
jgi:peptidoglycan hydrolase-like protein with peptidoglycan-binding domain